MISQEFGAFVQQKPFRPFRVTLTDGRTYDIVGPEFAVVGFGSVLLGIPHQDKKDPEYVRQVTVSLLHVMQLEALPTPKGSDSKTTANGPS